MAALITPAAPACAALISGERSGGTAEKSSTATRVFGMPQGKSSPSTNTQACTETNEELQELRLPANKDRWEKRVFDLAVQYFAVD